jgi:hypothetical protein
VQSFATRKSYSLRADANALGGYLEKPLEKAIPTLAPVSLPAVGGVATARSEAFTLDEIVSCSAAYTRVSGRENPIKGAIFSSSLLVTAVVEDLNILEVVRAERIVAQVSIDLSSDSALKISLAGFGFEGLRLAGQKCCPELNEDLQKPGLTWEHVRGAGLEQSEKLLPDFQKYSEDAYQWALSRHRRMSSDPKTPAAGDSAEKPVGRGFAQASLVKSLPVSGFARSCGHIVDIPHFGRIIFGELLISRETVQLVALRAELGCAIGGRITACCGGGGGTGEN